MSDTGGGHRSVSRALEQGFALIGDETGRAFDVRIVDLLKSDRPSPGDRITYLYGWLIRRAPWVYGLIYHGTNRKVVIRSVVRLLGSRDRERAGQIVLTHRPDLIVFTHSLCIAPTHDALAALRLAVPTGAMATELVEVHASWYDRRVDVTATPTPSVAASLRRWGADPDRLRLTGLPVGLRFGRVPDSPGSIRARLGLEPNRGTFLVVGGGEGSGDLDEVARVVARAAPDCQLIVVCGRNEELRRRLEREPLDVPAKILGFVDSMPDLMHAADVVVTKGGPQSIAEALASRRPVVLTQVLPGQEERNGRFVLEHGVGLLGMTAGDLARAIGSLAADAELRARLTRAAERQAQPEAAERAARAFAALLGPDRGRR